jgi:NagD protein
MTDRGPLPSFLMDMDGVLVHEEQAIPDADRLIEAPQAAGLPFLVLTNNSIYT